jgi:hypothetical protein
MLFWEGGLDKELLEIILGAIVIMAVITAVALFFKDQVIAFFKGLTVGKPSGIFLALIK